MKAAWICLGVCVATITLACREKMHPSLDEQPSAQASQPASETASTASNPTSSPTSSSAKQDHDHDHDHDKGAHKAEVSDNGYQVIRAKTRQGEGADVAIKAPAGYQVATSAPDSPDPHAGKFSLQEAVKGLPGKGKLHATIQTSLGNFECQLFDDKAPKTVANFVGLARGLRKFWSAKDKAWVARPYYDGTIFHRVIPEFMIQGGDWKGDGSGDMYYTIPDELHPSLKHDRGGLLCMANRGPNTNEAQFFITEAAAPHLDSSYTIFGECSPVELVKRIARVPQSGPPNNRPLTPVVIEKVTIERRPAGASESKAAASAPLPKGEAVRVPAPEAPPAP